MRLSHHHRSKRNSARARDRELARTKLERRLAAGEVNRAEFFRPSWRRPFAPWFFGAGI